MSNPNNVYVGYPLIPENPDHSVNEKSTIVCFYCYELYKIASIGTHFLNYREAMRKEGKDHKKQRKDVNEFQQKYKASKNKDKSNLPEQVYRRWSGEYPRKPLFKDLFFDVPRKNFLYWKKEQSNLSKVYVCNQFWLLNNSLVRKKW